MGYLNRLFRNAKKVKLKCSVCSKSDKSVAVCKVCGKPFCERHYDHRHYNLQPVPKKVEAMSPLYDVHWERGRYKPKPTRETPWNEFAQSYRDNVGTRSMFECPHCGAISENREICGNCMQRKT